MISDNVREGDTAADWLASGGLICTIRWSKSVIVAAWRSLLIIVGTPQSQ
jgi:hypothetical protein